MENYGARVTTAISGKTNYLIVGRDVSEAKTNKAREMKIEIISEDDLLEMIRTRPGDEGISNQQLPTTSKSSPARLKRNSSSTAKKTTAPDPSVVPKTSEPSPAKLKRNSSSTSKKTTDPDPITTSNISVDESNLLCKYSLYE